MDLAAAVKLGARVLAPDGEPLGADQLEVALLDRARARRTFRKIRDGELEITLPGANHSPRTGRNVTGNQFGRLTMLSSSRLCPSIVEVNRLYTPAT